MSGLADQDRADQDRAGQDRQVWPRPAVSAWQDPASVQWAGQPEQARPPAPTPSPAKRADPRGHWFLLAIGMLLAVGALVLNGYVTNVVGETRAAPPATDHPSPQLAEMRRGGPVLNLTGSEPSSAHLPNKTIALTFDDGPDPAWTPAVLDALKKHGAKATFFVVGSKVAKYPELARRIVAEGHELGSHTYTHAELAAVPGWRLRLELSLTQKALAGATGLHTALVRPPYSSTPEAITGPQWESMKALAAEGYLVTLADLDTKDWSRPGTRKIVTSSLPAGGRGAIVMMHDSGGDTAADRRGRRSGPEGARGQGLPGGHGDQGPRHATGTAAGRRSGPVRRLGVEHGPARIRMVHRRADVGARRRGRAHAGATGLLRRTRVGACPPYQRWKAAKGTRARMAPHPRP